MVVSLDGNTINVIDSVPENKAKIVRNKIAGSSRTNNINLGNSNKVFKISGYVKTEADYDTLDALIGQSGLTYVNKFGDSFTVSPTILSPTLKPHDFITYSLTLEEDS